MSARRRAVAYEVEDIQPGLSLTKVSDTGQEHVHPG